MGLTLTDLAALVGAVCGTTGLVLGILNYFRDRPKVVVTLLGDRVITNNLIYDSRKRWGLVTVTNVGRRTIYISHAALKFPKGYQHTHGLIMEGIGGQALVEGGPPASYVITQEGLEQYKKDWHKIRAQVSDTAGREYFSRVDKSKRPSWAS